MSSFYDDASLVVIPSGYKTSKVYAEKPTDGSGDLTFTRTGDTATRVNSAGLIEKVRTNLVLQSQTFDNASWNKTTDGQVTITANAAAAPDGTTTAEKMIPSAISGFHCVAQTITLSAGEVTISVYAKSAENSFLQIFDSLTTDFANFNLTTGVVGSTSDYVASIQSAGNGWFRCTATKVVPSGSFVLRYGVVTTATAVRGESFTGNGTDGLLIWGAQAEQGVATAYIPTTTAAVSVGPVSNVPRLDYLGSSCPRLLLEPQRTNVITYSEQFDNAAWVKTNAGTGVAPVVTANNAISPDGTQNADTVVFNSGAGTTSGDQSYLYQTLTTGAGSHTASFYAKTASGTAQLLIRLNSANYQKITITSQWQRFTLTQTLTAGTNYLDFILRRGINEPLNSSATIQLWGAQVEAGAYASSYIPTLAASATRGADACSKTGISSLIGQTEGTVFLEVDYSTLSGLDMFLSIRPNASNKVEVYRDGGDIWGEITASSSFGLSASKAVGTHKIAFAYKSGSTALYIDGVLAGQSTTAFTYSATLADLFINQRSGGTFIEAANYKQALLFKTRLTNAALAELTTL